MDSIRAKFVLDGVQYDVVDISAGNLQVECAAGFADETMRRISKGNFNFLLQDSATNSEIELVGCLVRSERAAQSDRVVRVWIAKNAQNWSAAVDRDDVRRRVRVEEELAVRRGIVGKTIAVGGGKGGVGKTIVAVNLAFALSRLRKRVTLFDGDAGNANCNTLLGITRIDSSLEEYLRRERTLEEITVATAYDGLKLICGAQNKVDASLAADMQRLLDDISGIDADYLVIDLGAGVGDATLDLYRLADAKIIVVTPQVTSLQNAYSFIKSALFHDLKRSGGMDQYLEKSGSDLPKLQALIGSGADGHAARRILEGVMIRQRFLIVGNMVNDDRELKIVQNLQKVVGQYLRIENRILGVVGTSEDIRASVNRITPFVALSPDLAQSREIKRMAAELTQRITGA